MRFQAWHSVLTGPRPLWVWATVRGVVKFWKAEKGWGAISLPALPPGRDAWVSFFHIEAGPNEYRSLSTGQEVEFTFEQVKQDSFDYRAIWVRALDSGPT